MKKIVNGRTYNTETAILICEYTKYINTDENIDTISVECSDNVEYTETMYQKKDGEYFLVGSGNGKYAKEKKIPSYGGYHGSPHPAYSRMIPSCKVIPMEKAEAEAWLKNHSNND